MTQTQGRASKAYRRSNLFLKAVVISTILMHAGCGSESKNDQSGDRQSEEAIAGNNQVLGPLSGAEISAYRLSDLNNPIETVTTSENLKNINVAGTFDLELAGVSDEEWIIVYAVDGQDIDANKDGFIDESPSENLGKLAAIATAEQWRQGQKITIVTDYLTNLHLTSSSQDVNLNLDQLASSIIEDINSDGKVDYEDALSFSPVRDKDLFRPGINELRNIYFQIRNGLGEELKISYYQSIYQNNVTEIEFETTETSKGDTYVKAETALIDGNKILKLSNINEDSRVDTFLHNNSGSPIGNTKIMYSGNILEIIFSVSDDSTLNYSSVDAINNLSAIEIVLSRSEDDIVLVDIPRELISSLSRDRPFFRFNGIPFTPDVISDNPLISWDVGKAMASPRDILRTLGLSKNGLEIELWANWEGQDVEIKNGIKLPERFTLTPRLLHDGKYLTPSDVTMVFQPRLDFSIMWQASKYLFFQVGGRFYRADTKEPIEILNINESVEVLYPTVVAGSTKISFDDTRDISVDLNAVDPSKEFPRAFIKSDKYEVAPVIAEMSYDLKERYLLEDFSGDVIDSNLWVAEGAMSPSAIGLSNGSLEAHAEKNSSARVNTGLFLAHPEDFSLSEKQAFAADFEFIQSTGSSENLGQLLLGLPYKTLPDGEILSVDTGISFYDNGEIFYFIDIFSSETRTVRQIDQGYLGRVDPASTTNLSVAFDGNNIIFRYNDNSPISVPVDNTYAVDDTGTWNWAAVRAVSRGDGTGRSSVRVDNVTTGSYD